MNFEEAFEKLNEGHKIYRRCWTPSFMPTIYLEKNEFGNIKALQTLCKEYVYDTTILMSDGWIVREEKEKINYTFLETIKFLSLGNTTRYKDWESKYLKVDKETNMLCVWDIEEIKGFAPSYKCMIAMDWEIYQGESTWKSQSPQ